MMKPSTTKNVNSKSDRQLKLIVVEGSSAMQAYKALAVRGGLASKRVNLVLSAETQNKIKAGFCRLIREWFPGAYLSWEHTYSDGQLTKLRLRVDDEHPPLIINRVASAHENADIEVLKCRMLDILVENLHIWKNPNTYNISIKTPLIADWEEDNADCVDTDQFGFGIFHKFV